MNILDLLLNKFIKVAKFYLKIDAGLLRIPDVRIPDKGGDYSV